MCGVLGFVLGTGQTVSKDDLRELISTAFVQSYSRGKEASGIAIRSNSRLSIFKEALSSKELLKFPEFVKWLNQELDDIADADDGISGPLTITAHARLMTNGLQGMNENNQPVRTQNTVVIHNGIIVNEDKLLQKYPQTIKNSDVDSEWIPILIDRFLEEGNSFPQSLARVFDDAEGQITAVISRTDRPGLLAGTNFGSLYCFDNLNCGAFICMSERQFLSKALENSVLLRRYFSTAKIRRLLAREGFLVDERAKAEALVLRSQNKSLATPNIAQSAQHNSVKLFDYQTDAADRRLNLKRCTRCILPETMPGIQFDHAGVCSYCNSHVPSPPKGLDALKDALEPYRRKDGSPELVMGLSGGRDSSFGVNFIRQELDINLIAYTYDWAMVTDLARRNISRICSKLELEHILISADIKQKRSYIRKNINAWLKSPDLGMVPLFMAGDKLFFYYYDVVRKNLGLDIAITCGNKYEKTDFKSGFCGVYNTSTSGEGKSWRPYDVSAFQKLRYFVYFAKHMGANPGYWNSSLIDSAKGFYASYVMKHKFIWLYDYIPWDENLINQTLADEFAWETAKDSDSTWRVGDGTASFYNYIYLTVAGFSEHDTFRSNQIRDGQLSRAKALQSVMQENVPRYESILEYSNLIGFDFDHALARINTMPKLY